MRKLLRILPILFVVAIAGCGRSELTKENGQLQSRLYSCETNLSGVDAQLQACATQVQNLTDNLTELLIEAETGAIEVEIVEEVIDPVSDFEKIMLFENKKNDFNNSRA